MDILSINNIMLNLDCNSKEEAFKIVAEKAANNGYIKSASTLENYFIERENQIATGLEDGLAIPHGKGDEILHSAIFYVRFKNGLEWETFDNSKVTDAIFFCIPNKGGDKYLQKLALISGALSSIDFRKQLKSEKSNEKILELLLSVIDKKQDKQKQKVDNKKFFVGVVACPAGLAHTYMAKKAIEDAGAQLGYSCQIEAHGAMGIEDKIKPIQIKNAEFAVMAIDVGIDTENRFDNIYSLKCKTSDVIKDAKKIILLAQKNAQGFARENSDLTFEVENTLIEGKTAFSRFMKWWGRDITKHLMTAIGYLIPLAIASSVLIGISRILAMIDGDTNLWDNFGDGKTWPTMNDLSGYKGFLFSLELIGTKFGLGTLFVPFICAFICYSMNGKGGLAPGFLVGFVCGQLNEGFIGAMVAGLITGYIIQFIQKYMKIRGPWASITPILLVPVLGTLCGGIVAWWGLGYPFSELNIVLGKGLNELSKTSVGAPLIAAVVAAMIAFDLGGPVNKAAYGIATGLLSTSETLKPFAQYTPNTATQLSIILPPLGLGLASFIGRPYYDDDLKESGKAAFIMGVVGVSEGAIPFAIKNPIRVTIINIVGCVAAATTCVALGSLQEVSLSAFYSWGFPTKPAIYIFSVFLGTFIITTSNVICQKIYFHEKTNTKYTIFNPIGNFKNFFIGTSNIFRKKDNKKQRVITSFEKFLEKNEIADLKSYYSTDSSERKLAKLEAKKEAKKQKAQLER